MDVTELVHARIHHARQGGARNAFAYGADFVLAAMPGGDAGGRLYRRNAPALFALLDRDHGEGHGSALAWARRFAPFTPGEAWLLTQPRFLGFVFNPVSFWFFLDDKRVLRAVLAEVNNTAGGRHAYLCAHDDNAPIGPHDTLTARKAMWVSPFQRASGAYAFRFTWRDDRVAVRIVYHDDAGGGMTASIEGAREPLNDRALLATALRRPLGSLGVATLIFWQAFKLMLKGERYRPRAGAHFHEGAG